VHLRHNDPRVSCSSSYFPLTDPAGFTRPTIRMMPKRAPNRSPLKPLRAKWGMAAIGLYLELLAPFVNTNDKQVLARWTAWQTRVAQLLATALASSPGPQFTGLSRLARISAPAEIVAVLKESWGAFELYRWEIDIAPYAGSDLVIFPFAGHTIWRMRYIWPRPTKSRGGFLWIRN